MMSDRRGAAVPYDEESGVGERVAVGPAVIVVPPLELDLASAGELEQDISNAYLAGAGKVTVDFASGLFCDSSGLRVLVNAAKLARRRGALFEVCNPSQQLLQMARIVGASDALDLPPTWLSQPADGTHPRAASRRRLQRWLTSPERP